MSTAADAGPARPGPAVVLGLVAAPGAPTALAGALVGELGAELESRSPGVGWQVQLVEDGLVQPPAPDSDLLDAGRRVLLARGWDLALVLTDLPLHDDRRTVVASASPVHAVALLSVPALGAVGVRRRARETALRLVDALLGATARQGEDGAAAPAPGPAGGPRRRWARQRAHRLRGLAAEPDEDGPGYTARVLTGNLRLLAGMVRANRPWRLAARLSRALVAAITAGVFALVTTDIWQLADAFGALRLAVVAVGSVAAIAGTLIVGAQLWEHADHPRVRQQVALFNIATTATVVLGVATFYAALFVLALLAALVLVVPSLLSSALGHPAGPGDYAELAWLTSSLATVGGALGAGLETDDAVRAAAYSHRADDAGEG